MIRFGIAVMRMLCTAILYWFIYRAAEAVAKSVDNHAPQDRGAME